nr:immunoglobulin light chain junction region [Macaca mulatta]MOX25650.1 immunoglobulin light chain junction region [Macaca mulatta]MOX27358.1 immunoglobulin light chain junction region [Macaca mulatta]
CQQDYNPPYTF